MIFAFDIFFLCCGVALINVIENTHTVHVLSLNLKRASDILRLPKTFKTDYSDSQHYSSCHLYSRLLPDFA